MHCRQKNKAMELDPNYFINKEILNAQEEATKKLKLIYQEIDNQEKLGGNGLHEHICTFKMISNDKSLQQSKCKKWLASHPIEYQNDDDFWSPCDFCAMMNYIARDDEGKIMYVSRNFPEDYIKWLKQYKERNKLNDNT